MEGREKSGVEAAGCKSRFDPSLSFCNNFVPSPSLFGGRARIIEKERERIGLTSSPSNIAKLCAQQPAAEQCRSSIVYNGVECWSFKKIENKNYKKTKIIKKQAQKSHSQLKST